MALLCMALIVGMGMTLIVLMAVFALPATSKFAIALHEDLAGGLQEQN